jgi:hypothetical protein
VGSKLIKDARIMFWRIHMMACGEACVHYGDACDDRFQREFAPV